jgi:hypothetical protein
LSIDHEWDSHNRNEVPWLTIGRALLSALLGAEFASRANSANGHAAVGAGERLKGRGRTSGRRWALDGTLLSAELACRANLADSVATTLAVECLEGRRGGGGRGRAGCGARLDAGLARRAGRADSHAALGVSVCVGGSGKGEAKEGEESDDGELHVEIVGFERGREREGGIGAERRTAESGRCSDVPTLALLGFMESPVGCRLLHSSPPSAQAANGRWALQ